MEKAATGTHSLFVFLSHTHTRARARTHIWKLSKIPHILSFSRGLAGIPATGVFPLLSFFCNVGAAHLPQLDTPRLQEEIEQSIPDEIDRNKKGGSLSEHILPHLFNLYNCTSSAPDYEIYDVNGTFEDPLMCAHGVKQIKSAFYSMPKVFSEAKIGEYTVHENEISPGTGEINIDNIQHYKLLGRQIDMVSLIKLQVKDGKVVRHEDLWDKKPLWNRTTVKVPLVGRVVEKVRRGNMFLTHALMGCGKDPPPKTE